MRKTNKLIFFSLILQIVFVSFFFFVVAGNNVTQAYTFQSPLPGGQNTLTPDGTTREIGDYIKNIYNYAIGVVAIIATVIMMFGGFSWITAGGNAERIGDAKAWITAALSGLVLVMASYTILSFVNEDLVNFKVQSIKTIDIIQVGCCQYKEDNKTFTEEMKNFECEKKPDKLNFFPGYVSDQQGGGCVDPGICCLVEFENKKFDCYEHMPNGGCSIGGSLFGDNVVRVTADPDYKGFCNIYKNPPINCTVKPLK